MRAFSIACFLLWAGCGAPPPLPPDGGPAGGGSGGGGGVAAVTPAREFIAGGGLTTGPGLSLEVQLGAGVAQTRATGPGLVIEGNAALKRRTP